VTLATLDGRDDEERAGSIDQYISNFLLPAQAQFFNYNGLTYQVGGVNQTMPQQRLQDFAASLPGYYAALRNCPPAFAAQLVRSMVLSQARFTFRRPAWDPVRPRSTFGNTNLEVLEHPWVNGTTADLVGKMEWHAGIAGNAFVTNYQLGRLRVLRPDWMGIIYTSDREPDDPALAIDSELYGYVYQNGGWNSEHKPVGLSPEQVAHWSPIPDPTSEGVGISWLTPGIRDIRADMSATEHKMQFFINGATPNMVVKGIPAITEDQFKAAVAMLEGQHTGVANAYRTLYLTAGIDATVVGSNLQQLDFAVTQGHGETRISVLSRVPPPLLGISEGLKGSSLNSGNFGMARRTFSDTWVYPTLQSLCAALAPLVVVPEGNELWFDTSDIPLLREDALDAANIESVKADTINRYITAGFTPESSVAAVVGQNPTLLKHTGLVSVQLQPPGMTAPPAVPVTLPAKGAKGQ